MILNKTFLDYKLGEEEIYEGFWYKAQRVSIIPIYPEPKSRTRYQSASSDCDRCKHLLQTSKKVIKEAILVLFERNE